MSNLVGKRGKAFGERNNVAVASGLVAGESVTGRWSPYIALHAGH